MGERSWTPSDCGHPDAWWYGISGEGSHVWTPRFGQYWIGGGPYQVWARQGYECGLLDVPVKEYGWVAEMNYGRGAFGQWFKGGAVGYHDGRWNTMLGDYGQTAGRLTDISVGPPKGTKHPADRPRRPPGRRPRITAEMRALLTSSP